MMLVSVSFHFYLDYKDGCSNVVILFLITPFFFAPASGMGRYKNPVFRSYILASMQLP